jgi:hypothetical protein
VPKATSRTYQIKTKDRLATLSRDYACVCPVRREDQRECLALVEVAAIGAARPIRSCGDGCDELPSQVAYTVFILVVHANRIGRPKKQSASVCWVENIAQELACDINAVSHNSDQTLILVRPKVV